MTNEDLLREIMSLPADAKRKVEKYVDYLRRSKTVPAASVQLEEEEFFGIWRDRDEMRDSTAWVRNIRETHWSK
jgi:hypothetical protein